MGTSHLAKLVSRHGTWMEDKAARAWVYHVTSPHLLIQAGGYLKHIKGTKNPVGVFFRGQVRAYGESLVPTLYRGLKSAGTASKRNGEVNKYLKACKKQGKVLKNVPDYAWEPLLQHYGIKTKWIDLVDNVWVALWFACHDAHATGKQGEYLHFEPRKVAPTEYAYVLLVEAGIEPDTRNRGLYHGARTEMIDLRVAVPSTFLRPHAQHGILARVKQGAGKGPIDYSEMVVGIIRISTSDAFSWLGNGSLLTTHVLFPSPVYDFGYRDFLGYAPPAAKVIGAIHHIGA